MINEYTILNNVHSATMDYLWADGWRHFGEYFFRYSSFQQDSQTFTVLPLRLSLKFFTPSKSQKRILKRNSDLTICFKPAFVNTEIETLFNKHKKRFEENIPDSIYTFISRHPAEVPCECQSLCLYRGGHLIGVSFLDMGENSTSSVYQCFDPLESKHSLGILMILLSIQHSQELGKSYYYPGYACKEPSNYDYKKTFKELQYFDWQNSWLPLK